jgi:DNA recombination protein RmuC
MNPVLTSIILLFGTALGALLVWLPLRARLRASQSATDDLRQRLDTSEAALGSERQARNGADARVAELQARLQEQQQSATEKLSLLKETETRMRDAFQTLSQQILDTKAKDFGEQSEKQLGVLLDPLKVQLKEFRDTVTQTNAGIHTLKELNQRITTEAANLTRALKGDTQKQGAWGELVLERILETSGLTAGRDFELQTVLSDDDGGRPRPDAIIRLPDSKDLVLDAKVSLTAYTRLVDAEDDATREQALKEHIASLRRHVDGLSKRNYSDLPGLRTMDFVLLFVPVEAAFIDAVRADDGLYRYALDKNIVIVGPSTLLATLRTVAHLWKLEDRNINAAEIARQAGALYDSFAMLEQEFSAVGEQIEKALRTHESAARRIGTGRGNLLGRVEKLRKLGADAKKQLPRDKLPGSDPDSDNGPDPENENGAE